MKAIVSALCLLLLVSACASDPNVQRARRLIDRGQTQEGLRLLQAAELNGHTDDIELSAFARRETEKLINRLLREAEAALTKKDYALAEERYRQVQTWNRDSHEAEDGLNRIRTAVRHDAMLAEMDKLIEENPADARSMLQRMLAENPRNTTARRLLDSIDARRNQEAMLEPQLTPSLRNRVSLSFVEQNLMSVFDLISRIAKLNFVFDKDVPRSLTTTIYARDTTAEEAINLLLKTNQLAKKTLNENTFLIYPNRPEKEREYKEMVMRTFYLSNADPAQVVALIKQMVNPKSIHADTRLGMVVVRDSPETMGAVERLVAAQDLAQSELALEVEILEVNNSDVLDLGIRYPDSIGVTPFGYGLQAAAASSATPVARQLTLEELRSLNKGSMLVSLGSPTVSLHMNDSRGNSKVLANPRIRVKNKEKATITIGDRVPIVTTTNNNGVTSESVTYLDVGLTLRVEPSLSLDDEIAVKVSLEVSNIVKTITTKNGLIAYQLGQRKAETVLTARDGETQVLAGLLSRSDAEETNTIPGLGALPVLDRIFGNRKDSQSKNEVMLLITPRIVRNLALPAPHITTFNSGTEAQFSLDPAQHASRDAAAADPTAPAATPGKGDK